MLDRRILVALIALLLAAPVSEVGAGTKKIKLQLPIPPRIDITGHEKVYIGPFMLEPGTEASRQRFDLTAELEDFMRRIIRRRTRLDILPSDPAASVPVESSLELPDQQDHWRNLADLTGAELIVTGSIDFKIRDRAGYTTEPFVSPVDGETYYRQVLVEETGFEYDILIYVFNRDGGLLHKENIKDFEYRPEGTVDELKGMFAELESLEDQLVGLFMSRHVIANRTLYTN